MLRRLQPAIEVPARPYAATRVRRSRRLQWLGTDFAAPPCAATLPAGATRAASNAYDCLIEPTQTVELGAPVAGLIDRVLVKRGDRVARNQVLATLEAHAEQAAADLAHYKSQLAGPTQQAQSKIEFSQRKFTRRRDMAAEKLMSRQDSDDAEAELKQAQAELVTAKENREVARLEYVQQSSQLALRTIRSPFDGVVIDQTMWPGEIFEPGATKHAVLKLAQLNPLRVRVVLPLRAFGEPSIGMEASIGSRFCSARNWNPSMPGIIRSSRTSEMDDGSSRR